MISKKNILELELRQKIYKIIQKNPGLHLQEISRKINIPKSTLQYHLRYLEKAELINNDQTSGYTRYYLTNKLGKREKEILKLLREDVPRGILVVMLQRLVCSQIELSQELEKAPKTISYHLNKLKKANIIKIAPIENEGISRYTPNRYIERKPVGREKIYIITLEAITIVGNLYIAYHKSFKDNKNLHDFIELLKEFQGVDIMPYKKVPTVDIQTKNLIDVFFEVFPHPYHI